MDKYEFNVKIEQIKKLSGEGDYATAQKIVDSIDWNRVRNVNLLTLASSVYEENDRLDDAKDALVMAYERSPVGKRILYKLTELAVRSGNVQEAEDYYQEYHQVAGDDPSCLLLQYMIMKVKHAPYPQLIECLELYNQYEPDEKWMYELATTYESSGRIQDAVALADRIALMFGSGTYGVKALKLKQKYVKLTEEQRALLYPNSIANSGVHYAKETRAPKEGAAAPEAVLSLGDRLAASRYDNEDAVFAAYVRANDPFALPEEETAPVEEPVITEKYPEPVTVEEPVYEEEPAAIEEPAYVEEPAPAEEPVYEEEPAAIEEPVYVEEPAPAEEPVDTEEPVSMNTGFLPDTEVPQDTYEEQEEYLDAAYTEPAEEPAFDFEKVSRNLSEEAVKAGEAIPGTVTPMKDPDADTLLADAKIAASRLTADADETIVFRPRLQARPSFTAPAPAPAAPAEAVRPAEAPKAPVRYPAFHLIVEAEDDQEGLDIAIEELKLLHAERGLSNGAVKTAAEKLNEKGLTRKAAEKIAGRDFVIEHAGELYPEVADQVYALLSDKNSDVNVVLIDNSDGLDKLEETKGEIFDLCELITAEDARKKDYRAPEETPAVKPAAAEKAPEAPERRVVTPSDDDVMDIDDFAQYCVQYAQGIDCVIDGKSMLALYERIELMEEDGIALTKTAAEDLIEETADHAEKPPIGKRLTGLFHAKYNKEGLLILKEEDFIH